MKNTEKYKALLEAEYTKVIDELQSVGRVNPSNPTDWEATEPEHPETQADENEVADNIEDYEGNNAILNQLEIRFNEIKSAIKKIEDGSFGHCDVCKKEIETERLDANPAAETCKEHMK